MNPIAPAPDLMPAVDFRPDPTPSRPTPRWLEQLRELGPFVGVNPAASDPEFDRVQGEF